MGCLFAEKQPWGYDNKLAKSIYYCEAAGVLAINTVAIQGI